MKIGIVGSGFISKGFFLFSEKIDDIEVSCVLTRSNIQERNDFPQNLLTNDIDTLISSSDIILECSGDTIHATNCINEILKHDIPILTINSEFHITCGQYFYKKGILFEAEGDQSGCIYALNREIKQMGFNPLVYGNYKKYLKKDVSKKQASYWSKRNKVSLDKTIAFTDGTKVQIENVFLANSLDAYIYDKLIDNDKLNFLIKESQRKGKPFIDYFLDKKAPSGVFIATEHEKNQKEYLKYLGFKGDFQIIERPYHFCHLEVYKSIKKVLSYDIKDQMRNTINRYMVASISKKELKAGTSIKNGLGSVEFIGWNHKYDKDIVPITLLKDVIIKNDLPANKILTFDDIEYKDNLATKIWRENVK